MFSLIQEKKHLLELISYSTLSKFFSKYSAPYCDYPGMASLLKFGRIFTYEWSFMNVQILFDIWSIFAVPLGLPRGGTVVRVVRPVGIRPPVPPPGRRGVVIMTVVVVTMVVVMAVVVVVVVRLLPVVVVDRYLMVLLLFLLFDPPYIPLQLDKLDYDVDLESQD